MPVKQWHGIVEHYSKLNLTKQTDRLPALSGLAHRMAPFLGAYHAGLWRASLLLDLAWRVDKTSGYHPQEYIGPSWSWVSVNTGVRYLNLEDIWLLSRQSFVRNTDHCRRESSYRRPIIRFVQVTTNGKNYYGEISSAVLVVLGLLRPARLLIDQHFLSPTDMATFELEIELSSASSCKVPSVRLPFPADYILKDRVRGKPRKLYLFALFPRVCLVLSSTRQQKGELNVYKRVGIG